MYLVDLQIPLYKSKAYRLIYTRTSGKFFLNKCFNPKQRVDNI